MATASSVYWCGVWHSSFTQWKWFLIPDLQNKERLLIFPQAPAPCLWLIYVFILEPILDGQWPFHDWLKKIFWDLRWVSASSGWSLRDSSEWSWKKILVPCPGIEFGQLVVQTVKKLPAMLETWVWSLGWEDPLKEGMATHSSILALKNPTGRGAWQAAVHRVTKSWTQPND